MLSTGSPHSCVQLTGLQVLYIRTPHSQVSDTRVEPGAYLPWGTGFPKSDTHLIG